MPKRLDFPESTSVLMTGAPGVGMTEFTMNMVKRSLDAGDRVIIVTVDKVPKDIISTLSSLCVDVDTHLGDDLWIIDSHTNLMGSFGSMEPESQKGIKRVSDLEGIMYNVSELAEPEGQVRVLIHSLSTLFLHNQPNVVLKFFQMSSSKIRSELGSVLFTLHSGVHDDRIVNHLMAMADGTVDLRFDDDMHRVFRIRGGMTSSDWIPFSINPISQGTGMSLMEWRGNRPGRP